VLIWFDLVGTWHVMANTSLEHIEHIHCARAGGKNTIDSHLMLDALELVLTQEHIKTFVLISNDRDFGPVIRKLRVLGRYMIVSGSLERVWNRPGRHS
jgi:NYN domain